MKVDSSYIDELTRVYNRRYLKEKLGEEIQKLITKNINFSVAWVDIDHFKDVNDTYGHFKGDEVLRKFAQFLKDSLRERDTVIRFGGDEFICVIPHTGRQEAEQIYGRILKRCKEKRLGDLKLTISVGISSFPNDGRHFEGLLKIADDALYDAKRSGRDRIGALKKKRIELPIKVFISRVEEKERLKKLVSSDGNGLKVGTIKGNVGIGKTRLTKEVLSDIKGREIIWSDCLSFAENIAYYPIREAIKYRIKRQSKEILEELPMVYKMEIGKLIPELMEEIKEKTEGVELILDKYRLYESIRRVFEVGEKEKVIVVDNIQWIDNESTEVIKYLMRTLRDKPITLILIYRAEEISEFLENFLAYISREVNVTETKLSPFEHHEIKECVRSIIGEEPEKNLSEYIIQESGGNPFFIEEIMRELVDGRYLLTEDEKWVFNQPQEGLVPKSIEDVSMRKYRSLSKEAQDVLDIASVIGWFDIEMIKEMTDYNEGHIIGLIEDINRAGLSKLASGRVEFAEEICRNAIYNKSVAGIKGRMFHKKVGEIFEKRYKGKENEVLEELAFHYYRGFDREKGVKYSIEAGDRAREKYANQEAERYYTWSLELLKLKDEGQNTKARIDCLLKRAGVLSFMGNNESAIRDLEEGLKESKAIKDRNREANIILKKSSVYLNASEYKEAILQAEECKKICEEIGEKNNVAESINTIAGVHFRRGDNETAISFLKENLKNFREIGNKKGEATTLGNIGLILYDMGDWSNALKYHNAALKIANETGNKLSQAVILSNIGNVNAELGDYRSALKYYEDALDIQNEIGDKRGGTFSLINICNIYKFLGEYNLALKSFEPSLKRAREIGNRYCESVAVLGIADTHYYLGDYDTALRLYDDAEKIIEQTKLGREKCYVLLVKGRAYLALNNMKKAKEFLDAAYDLAKELSAKTILRDVLFMKCEFYMEDDNLEAVKKTIKHLENLGKEIKTKRFRCRLDLLLGRYYIKTKNFNEADKYLKKSLEIYGRSEHKLNIGRIYYYLGIMKLSEDERSLAKEYLNKSLEIFNSMGAKDWKAKAEKQLKV